MATHSDSGSETRSGSWYVVQTLSGQEERALLNLQRQDYRAFFPAFRRQVKHARQMSWKRQALFPGYIFVQLDLTRDNWHPINGTFGVSHIIRFAGRPARLPAGFAESLAAASDEQGQILMAEALDTGDQVRVLSGAFTDWLGTVIALPGRDRSTILVDILSRKVPVTLDRDSLLKVS